MRMGVSALLFRRTFCALLFGLIAFARINALASQGNDEVTPEVQNLYAEAKAARQHGDSATAVEKYKQIIKLAPHLAAAYNNLGMVYFDSHDYESAAKVLQHGLELNPNMPSA